MASSPIGLHGSGALPPRLVVAGSDALAARLVEELVKLEEMANLDNLVTAVVRDEHGPFARRMRDLHAALVEGDPRDPATLRTAGVGHARALALLADDDVGNMHAALAAQELNPGLRLVIRMFNRRLGERIEHMFDDCTVLSSSAIAAPFFVDAAWATARST